MLIGCCGSMIDPVRDPVGLECIEPLAAIGYDYVELSLAHLMQLDDVAITAVIDRLRKSNLPCRACNNFFPSHLRLTGPSVNLAANLTYARLAIARAAKIGATIIVFGSSGAKNVPGGFPPNQARAQLVELLQHLGPIAFEHGITIVIEPISRPESNIILTAADGFRLMQEVNHPHVRLLVDFYHMTTEFESDLIILETNEVIRHLHLATSGDRLFPCEIDQATESFFHNLESIQYCGGISIEAYTKHFIRDAASALQCLERLLNTERCL